MTGFLKEKAVGQVDAILINGEVFCEKQIKEVLKGVVPWDKNKVKEMK